MKGKDSNQIDLADWMKEAKAYAKRRHKINYQDDHEFWIIVNSYWEFEFCPEEAIEEAIKIHRLDQSL